MRPVVVLPLLLACRTPPDLGPQVDWQDRATDASLACAAPADSDLLGLAWADPAALPIADAACVDRLFDDFGVDFDSFAAVDGLADPYGVVAGDDLTGTRLGSFFALAQALLILPFGSVDQLDSSPYVSPAFVEVMGQVAAETGQDQLGLVLYDFVTSIVERTEADADDSFQASFYGGDRRMVLRRGAEPAWVTGQIAVHEVRHLWSSHVVCADGDTSNPHCDPDPSGPLGFELATIVHLRRQLWEARSLDEVIEDSFEDDAWRITRHILSFVDEDGDVIDEIAQLDPDEW